MAATLATVAARIEAAGVPYLARPEWGASAPLGPAMTLPARESWVHHSVTVADDDHDMLATGDVADDMRELERVGVARFGRFSYSFAVHPSGVIGEGAGLTIGAHTAGHNSAGFGIVAIGNYSTAAPPAPMIRAFAVLLNVLEAEGLLVSGSHPTGGHRDTKATGCPGDLLYARLGEIRALADDPALLDPQEDDMALNQELKDHLDKIREDIVTRIDGTPGVGMEEGTRSGIMPMLTRILAGTEPSANGVATLLVMARSAPDVDEAALAEALAPLLVPLIAPLLDSGATADEIAKAVGEALVRGAGPAS